MKNLKNTKKSSADNSRLFEVLLSFQDFHAEGMGNAKFSYELLESGVKTSLTQSVEKMVENPLVAMSEMINEMDDKVKQMVEAIVKAYFNFRRDLIASAYKTNLTSSAIQYSIVLKEDNTENRNTMFEFFDTYDNVPFSTKFPVYFQFTPAKLAEKIKLKEEVVF